MAGNKKQNKKVPPWSGLCTFVSPINIHSMEEQKRQLKITRRQPKPDNADSEEEKPQEEKPAEEAFAICPQSHCDCAALGRAVPIQKCILRGKRVDMKEIFNEIPSRPIANPDPLETLHKQKEREWNELLNKLQNKVEFCGVIEQGEFVNERTIRLRVVADDGLTYADVIHYCKEEISDSTLTSMLGEKAGFIIDKSDIKWNKIHRVWSPITGQVVMDFLLWLDFLPQEDIKVLVESRMSMAQFVEKIKKEFFV